MLKYCHLLVLILFSSVVQAHLNPECTSRVHFKGSTSSLPNNTNTKIPYPQINTELVVQIFKKAVERGELKLFEVPVSFAELKPQQVEFTYTIGKEQPIVKVYSLLIKSMPLPAMPDIHIEGVTVILDEDGHILEAIAHSHH